MLKLKWLTLAELRSNVTQQSTHVKLPEPLHQWLFSFGFLMVSPHASQLNHTMAAAGPTWDTTC
jgi:hypothetical protein